MNAVETINRKAGELVAAYTFDAGPNAVIYYEEKNSKLVAGVFRYILTNVKGWDSDYGAAIRNNDRGGLESKTVMTLKAGVSRVICTGVGGAPERVDTHLVDERGQAVSVDD